jgi:hypothetical protein
VRQFRVNPGLKGFRPRTLMLVTTLMDPVVYPAEALAELYLQRWRVELLFREPCGGSTVTLPFAAAAIKCPYLSAIGTRFHPGPCISSANTLKAHLFLMKQAGLNPVQRGFKGCVGIKRGDLDPPGPEHTYLSTIDLPALAMVHDAFNGRRR